MTDKELRNKLEKTIGNLKLVEVQEINSDIGPIFLVNIGGQHIRTYLTREEAEGVRDYMLNVEIITILKFLFGTPELLSQYKRTS